MKKLLITSVSALAVLGLAACSDTGTDDVTTQSTTEETQTVAPTEDTTQAAPSEDTMTTDMNSMEQNDATQPSAETETQVQPMEDGQTDDSMNSTTTAPAN